MLSEFSEHHHSAAYQEFLAYKTRVPVRGAIMLNEAMDQVVLVKGWKKGARWSFPRGKINKDEEDLDCAIREVYEETGFDIREAGLAKDDKDMKYIEVSMREQHMKLYVFRGVPVDTHFEPRTRKEISKIDWYKLSDLPTLKRNKQKPQENGEEQLKDNMFYMVAPFLGPLRHWIKQQHKQDRIRASRGERLAPPVITETDLEGDTTADEDGMRAAELTADEEPVEDVHGLQASKGHLDRLLASLQKSQLSDAESLPEVTSGPELVDPAEELKRLLSVGNRPVAELQPHTVPVEAPQATYPQPNAMPPASNPLLALFQSNEPKPSMRGPSMRAPGNGGIPPRTPLEQTVINPIQPRSPHGQHHPRPPPFPGTQPPPPMFPFSPNHVPPPHPPPFHHQAQNHFGPPPQFAQPRPQPLQFQELQSRPPQNIPLPFPPQQQLPRPYQRTGDPEFTQQAPPSAINKAIPPASQLPQPKLPQLNAHRLALLNTFKGSDSKPVSAAVLSSPVEAATKTPKANAINQIYGASRRPSQQPSNMSMRFNVPATTRASTDVSLFSNGPPYPDTAKPPDVQKSALLDLFRSSPSSSKPAAASELNVEPVELSAQPSPGNVHVQRHASRESSGPTLPMLPFLNTEHAPKPKPGSITSATVSGPLNAPNFDAVRRQNHTAVELNGQSPMTSTSHTPIEQPISILQRPQVSTPEMVQKPRPVPVHTVSPKTNLAAPQPKHFQPQILRRGQHGMVSPAPPQNFDRRDSVPHEQKNALLSLFNKAPTQSPQHVPSGIISPVSPLPAVQSKQGTPGPTGDVRSRISSIASIPSESGNANLAAPKKQGSVAHSPITPVDKSFLLGYLEGVAKGAR